MESAAARQVRRLAVLTPFLLIGTAHAQVGNPGSAAISYLNTSTGTSATFVSPQNPLPVAATFSGSIGSVNTALNAASTLSTLAPGTQTPQGSLAGAAYVQPVFGSAVGGGTIVDGTHPLPMTLMAVGGGATATTFGSSFPTAGLAPGARNPGGTMSSLSVDASGSLLVNVASGGGGGTAFNAAFPAIGQAAGYRDPNGNMRFGSVDLGGLVQVGNPVWTVVGPGAGLTAQRVALSSDSADNTVTLSQNPTTIIGTVIQGTAAAPTNQWPMTIYSGANQLAINGSGQFACSNCGGSSSGPPLDVRVGPTALTSNGTALLALGSQGTGAATIVLTASSGLTANFEGLTPAGWSAIAMDNTATGQTQSTASADGIWQTNPAGYSQIRVNVLSGSTTASLESSAGSIPTGVDSAIYMATPPTLTDGTSAGMTMTNDARLRVSMDTAQTTNRSVAIVTGGTSQQLIAANANRRRLLIQNPCGTASEGIANTENIYLNFTSSASATAGNSVELQPCGSLDTGSGPVTPEAINVVAATSGHQIMAREF